MIRRMTPSQTVLSKSLLGNVLGWFHPELHRLLVTPVGSQFPNFPLPRDIQAALQCTAEMLQDLQGWDHAPLKPVDAAEKLSKGDPRRLQLFKEMVNRYRRWRATYIESLTEKTFHPEMTETLEQEVKTLDALVNEEWFQQIESQPLPRLKEFLPVQFIEATLGEAITLQTRQYDEKFHILQAPALFLQDLAYFRAKCEIRDAKLTVAFLDIDDFKKFNSAHNETKVDRNLLPRFMQTIEAHVYHHGFAYRQGGDEYLVLLPSLSDSLAISFLDELRCKLATLKYPEIDGSTTVSIGMCNVDPDCPLTDRELRDRASEAKKFAKDNGKNCIATYVGPRFIREELRVVKP
jgi:diguanylate cyclase (GGDEF)-like protein